MAKLPATTPASATDSPGTGAPNGACPLPSHAKVSLSDIQVVQNLIEKCLQNYLSKEEVVNTLAKRSNIPAPFTTLVLQQLEQQNPEFFWMYYLRLKLKDQIVLFNYLLDQQTQMVENLQRFMNGMPASPALFPRPPGMIFPQMSPLLAQQIQMQCSQAPHRAHTSQPGNSYGVPVIKREEPVNCSTPQQQAMCSNAALPSDAQTSRAGTGGSLGGNIRDSSPLTGGIGSQGTDLSLPMEVPFPGALFGCPSPDINLPGAATDLMSGGGLQELGVGPNNEFQGLVDNLAYNNLDQQVEPLPHEEKNGLGGSWAMDLPKIGSFSDMAALDLENLNG